MLANVSVAGYGEGSVHKAPACAGTRSRVQLPGTPGGRAQEITGSSIISHSDGRDGIFRASWLDRLTGLESSGFK